MAARLQGRGASVDELARLCAELRLEIADRETAELALEREYQLRDAENAIRVRVASMDQPEHLCRVVAEVGGQLRAVGVDHDSCTIQVFNEAGSDFVSFATYIHDEWQEEFMAFVSTGQRGAATSNAELYPWVGEVWRTGVPRYVGRTEISGSGATFSDLSLIDVPFSRGTLAINKGRVDAFTEGDVAILGRFGRVLSEGFQRFADIVERNKAVEQVRRSLREKEVLLLEVHHRVKNNLQAIASLLNLQASRSGDAVVRAALRESESRVYSMASVHETLYKSRDLARVDLAQYLPQLVTKIVRSHRPDTRRIDLDFRVAAVPAGIDVAIACGLIVNELVINALKYAFVDGAGQIRVAARREAGGRAILTVADDGVGMPAEFDWRQGRSLGLEIVDTLVKQLRGEIELRRASGTEWVVIFPLANL